MGSWAAYHLTLGPGSRDPDRVAAELRAALPPALSDVVHSGVDLDRLLEGVEQRVWVEDGRVHYATGTDTDIHPWQWIDLVTSLPVPARWACAVYRIETDAAGGVDVFGWVDGGYVFLDRPPGQTSTLARTELDRAERWWGVTGDTDENPPGGRDHDEHPVADPDPGGVDGFRPVDRSSLPAIDDALDALDHPDPARRREVAEQLYVLVTERKAPVGLEPALFEALDDEAARFAAGATVHELDVTTAQLRDALTHEDPARRRAAARFCFLQGPPDLPETATDAPLDRSVDVPVEALEANLSASSHEVRREAALAFDRSAIDSRADPPAEVTPALLATTDDPDPEVRAVATAAAARYALQHGGGDGDAAVDALVDGLLDDDPAVRDRIDAAHVFVGIGQENVVRHPFELEDDCLDELAYLTVRLVEADAVGELTEGAESFVTRMAMYDELVELVLDDLVAVGWDDDGALAREAVRTAAGRTDLAVDEALVEFGVDPDEALD